MSKEMNFNVSFFIKRTKLLTNGEAPIYMRIAVGGQRIDLGINRSLESDQWDSVGGMSIGNSRNTKTLNKYLQNLKYKITDIFNDLTLKHNRITAKMIRNEYLGIDSKERSILQIHENYNKKVYDLIGIDYARGTYSRYKISLMHLTNYINIDLKETDYPIRNIDHKFVTAYDEYLKVKCKLVQNTAIGYHKKLKKVLHQARAHNWISHDPYANFKLSEKKTDRGFLTDSELEKIINKDISVERLEQVRDCFVVSCFTGLAYADLSRLTENHINIAKDGSKWIKINRLKTDTLCSIPILNIVELIIDKYKNHPARLLKRKLLPVISNQRMNGYLKEIANLCKISKDLTTHLARHTFATTVTLNNDIPLETVSKMLGHTSLKTTKIYARLLDKKVGKDMNKLNSIYT